MYLLNFTYVIIFFLWLAAKKKKVNFPHCWQHQEEKANRPHTRALGEGLKTQKNRCEFKLSVMYSNVTYRLLSPSILRLEPSSSSVATYSSLNIALLKAKSYGDASAALNVWRSSLFLFCLVFSPDRLLPTIPYFSVQHRTEADTLSPRVYHATLGLVPSLCQSFIYKLCRHNISATFLKTSELRTCSLHSL